MRLGHNICHGIPQFSLVFPRPTNKRTNNGTKTTSKPTKTKLQQKPKRILNFIKEKFNYTQSINRWPAVLFHVGGFSFALITLPHPSCFLLKNYKSSGSCPALLL